MDSFEFIKNWFDKHEEKCIDHIDYGVCRALLATGPVSYETDNSGIVVTRKRGKVELSCLVVSHSNKSASVFYVGQETNNGPVYMRNDKDTATIYEPERERRDPIEELKNILMNGDIEKMCFDVKSIQLMIDCEAEKIHRIGGEACFITYKQIRSIKRHMYVVIFDGINQPVVLDVMSDDEGEVATVRHVSGSVMRYKKNKQVINKTVI